MKEELSTSMLGRSARAVEPRNRSKERKSDSKRRKSKRKERAAAEVAEVEEEVQGDP